MVVPSNAESSPSTADIDAITSRRFSNSFRGWDPDEVRVHLVNVAEMVRSLTQRQAELERLLVEAEATARRADLTRLDPDEVGRVLGEETARVLRTAREAAAEIEAKATAQAELLARQAADDAARLRADADTLARRITEEAREEASATRAAGEAHLADVRAEGEAEVERLRAEMEAEIAAERAEARDEGAALLATAQDDAATIRREAEEDAARTREEAAAEVAALRAAVGAELAEQRATTEAELGAAIAQAEAQVADAERMRDRILADLARRRRTVRQHLEQLHAARDRLVRAYDVVRATTDEATAELDVVLGDAKRASDDAARRVAAEDLPSAEELLAELELARSAGLPIVAAPEESGSEDAGAERSEDVAAGPDESVTVAAPEAETGGDADADSDADTAVPAPEAAAGEHAAGGAPERSPVTSTGDGDGEPPADGGGSVGAAGAHDTVAPVDAPALAVRGDDPTPSGGAVVLGQRNGRRRRGGHRRDPLEGQELPDVPMVPVDAAADFERVRVVASDAAAEAAPTAGTVADAGPAEATGQPDVSGRATRGTPVDVAAVVAAERSEAAPAVDDPAPASESSAAAASSTAREAGAEPSGEPAGGHATGEKPTGRDAASEPPVGSVTADPAATDDAVSGIFARLRAEAGEQPEPGATPDTADTAAGKQPAGSKKSAAEPKKSPEKKAEPKESAKGSADEKAAAAANPDEQGTSPVTKKSASKSGPQGSVADAKSSSGSAKTPDTATPQRSVEATPAAKAQSSKGQSSKAQEAGKPSGSRQPAASGRSTGPQQADGSKKSTAAGKPAGSKKSTPAAAAAAGSKAAGAALAAVFERRDAAVDEVARRLAKHLKRTLSDQQSELLDALRQQRGVPAVDDLLGAPEAFADGWATVITTNLRGAVAAGAALAGDLHPAATDRAEVDLAGPTAELVDAIAVPLRARLARALGEDVGTDDEDAPATDDLELADRIRACYREWRGARLAASVADASGRAFGLGVRAAVPAGTGLRWYGSPGDNPCSDCNDNQLAGLVSAGEQFPTGQQVAPAHPGCRCLALPELT